MKHYVLLSTFILLIAPISCIAAASCSGSSSGSSPRHTCKTVFLPFSASESKARDYASVDQLLFLPGMRTYNWFTSLAVEFNQNFNKDKLGAYFFPNGTNTLTVGPNAEAGTDIRNSDIGLSSSFQGTLTINPRIRNVVAEPSLYVGLDHWAPGLWLWCKLPINNTRWALDCCETDTAQGASTWPSGFMSPGQIGVPNPVPCPAFNTENQIQQALGGTLTWGNKTNPLNASRLICCESNFTGIADFPFQYGYNFIHLDKGYLGYYTRIVFPTGHTRNRQSIFDATIGYNHWQWGSGLNAGVNLYESTHTQVRLVADGYYTYIFSNKECRVFDLKNNGCMSRYLLMQVADNNGNYTGKLVNFTDVFTACVKSHFNWNIDAIIFLQARCYNWTAEAGYEFRGRDKETLKFGRTLELCDPCNADSCSTACCNAANELVGTQQYGIKGILNVSQIGGQVQTASTSTISTAGPQDVTPVLINASNVRSQLDVCSAEIPRALSHSVWANISYTSPDRDYPLFIGLGAQGEFAQNNGALSRWALWAKGGLAYN